MCAGHLTVSLFPSCRVGQYRFCQIMAENLPRLREDIKERSMSDLKDFLESIRKHSDKVGETAMRQVRTRVGAGGWSSQGARPRGDAWL